MNVIHSFRYDTLVIETCWGKTSPDGLLSSNVNKLWIRFYFMSQSTGTEWFPSIYKYQPGTLRRKLQQANASIIQSLIKRHNKCCEKNIGIEYYTHNKSLHRILNLDYGKTPKYGIVNKTISDYRYIVNKPKGNNRRIPQTRKPIVKDSIPEFDFESCAHDSGFTYVGNTPKCLKCGRFISKSKIQ